MDAAAGTPETKVERLDDPALVLARAGAFLASEPVLHNLVQTLLRARVRQPEPGRYWVAYEGPDVVGVAFQSPTTFPATMTPMPAGAVAAVVAAMAGEEVVIPGITADAATAARFAGEWTEWYRAGATPYNGQRIYELRELVAPRRPVAGGLRAAVPHDEDLLLAWLRAFNQEVGEPPIPVDVFRRRVAERRFFVWEDAGAPVSFAAHTHPVGEVVRLGPVFTPPELRNRGYAGACVHALSARLLAQGLRCVLFTDLSNPVSNSIYRAMGYQAVVEVLRYRFGG